MAAAASEHSVRGAVQARSTLTKKKADLESERHQVEKLQKKFALIHRTLARSQR